MEVYVKKVNVFFVMMVCLLGLGLASCNNDNGDGNGGGGPNTALNGHWINSTEGVDLLLNNGNFTWWFHNGDTPVEAFKGTYTTNGNNITMTIIQINGVLFEDMAAEFGVSTEGWYTQSSFKNAVIKAIVDYGLPQAVAEGLYEEMFGEEFNEIFAPQTGTYAVSGSTLTLRLEDSEEPLTLSIQ